MTRWLYTIVMFLLLVGAVFAVNGRFSPAASVPQVNADSDHLKVSICHFDGGSGKYSSIDINITSISDCTTAGGHDGHANDIIPAFTFSTCVYPGKNLSMVSWIANNCSQPLTPTPTQGVTPTPTVNPSATPTPTGVQPTVTPTPTNAPTATPTVGPTATPTPTGAPTATPTPTSTPSNGGNSGGGSGGGDGRSDGLSSCPQCTQAPHQQGVLGASTMADTGSFEQNLMNIFTVLGVLTMSTAGMLYKKTRQESLA